MKVATNYICASCAVEIYESSGWLTMAHNFVFRRQPWMRISLLKRFASG